MTLWYTIAYIIGGIITWMIVGRAHANSVKDRVAEYKQRCAEDSWYSREHGSCDTANSMIVGFGTSLIWPLVAVGFVGFMIGYVIVKMLTMGAVRKFFTGYSEPVWQVD